MTNHRITVTPVLALILSSSLPGGAWSPGVAQPEAVGNPATPLAVNQDDRNDVVAFHQFIYKASDDSAGHMDWTGQVSTCTPGTTGTVFRDDVRRRINWFRAMAGVPADIVFSSTFNNDAQAAALIMAEQGALSHTPGASFGTGGCWTAAGDHAAGAGNLALGSHGPGAIDGYIEDTGSNNLAVGHRRWILSPQITTMGSGDIPSSGTYPYTSAGEHWSSNCLYVIDSASYRPGTGGFVSWPPPGFVPATTLWPRWSLHYSRTSASPTFGSATVTMTEVSTGTSIPTSIIYRYTGGGLAGDPAIAWEPNWAVFGGSPPMESEIEVTVSGITAGSSGAPGSHTYRLTIIDPEVVTDPVVVDGTATPPASGAPYTFTPLSGVGAEGYEVGISAKSPATWTEGAEDSPVPQVIDQTSAGYALRTNLTPAYGKPGNDAGSRVFHLAIPSFNEAVQIFEMDRTVIPSASSRLQFRELFRWATTTSRLRAEVSTNGGSWTELWSRTGNGANSTSGWPSSWSTRDIDLAAFSGQPIRIRFRYTGSGSTFLGTDNTYGFFVDAITVTNAQQLGDEHVTPLPGSASGFTLDATTANGPLTVGAEYVLRVRPILGGKTFGFDSPLIVTVSDSPPGFQTWIATDHPDLTPDGPTDDPDGDGLTSLLEYALGTHPGIPNSGIPGLVVSGDQVVLTVDTASLGYETPDLTYGAESSADLVTWTPVPDTGSGSRHTFVLPSGPSQRFGRWIITPTP